jgi:glutamyl-Q tRNA(Asp) synthetase
MEDLDQPRVVEGMDSDILRTLEKLGFEWDGEVVYQSTRTAAYTEAFEHLINKNAAFACGCTRKELREAASAPHDAQDEPVYPGTCRHGLPPGKEPRAHRVKIGDGAPVEFNDMVQGAQSFHLTRAGGDFVILRADGVFAYQLAVVVDDAWQGINQVVRGADLLGSTPRQIHLQRLLGYPLPRYAHLPLVIEPDGKKLSKRDSAISLTSRANGTGESQLEHDGTAMLLAALKFLGQKTPAELKDATPRECLEWAGGNFKLGDVPKKPAAMPGG